MFGTTSRLRPLAVGLALLLLTAHAGVSPRAASAQDMAPTAIEAPSGSAAAIATALQPMREAYGLLLQRYAVPLDASDLVDAAQAGMDQALQEAGVASPPKGLGVIGDAPGEQWIALRQRFQAIASQYADRVSTQDLAYAAIAGMADSVDDAHTRFIRPPEFADEQEWEQGDVHYAGIGTRLDGTEPTIVEVFPDSPAEAAGLQPGDMITTVDGQSTAGAKLDQIVDRVRGPEGTPVVLGVQRAGSPQTEEITLVRAQVGVPFVESRRLPNNLGYVKLRGFPEPSVVGQVEQAIRGLQAAGVQGIVFDLRGNGGGRLDVGTRLLADFVAAGPIYQSVDREGHEETGRVQNPHALLTVPLAVLIDHGTASMGEIFAAALQEHHVGTVLGTTSAGAVAASVFLPLADGSALQLSIERVYTGAGAPLDKVGVQPDAEVELDLSQLRAGHDVQLEEAMHYLQEQASQPRATAPAGAMRPLADAARAAA